MAPLRKNRAQTVMEFMMTYGWAILIIVIILAVLFYLGVLNPNRAFANTCLFPPGHSCYIFKIANGTGTLYLNVGQATGKTMRVNSASCSKSGSASLQSLSTNVTIPSGEQRWVAGGDTVNYITCTDENDQALAGTAAEIGERYKGKLCLGYEETATGTNRLICGDVVARLEPPGDAASGGTVFLTWGSTVNTPGTYSLAGDMNGSGTAITFNSGASGSTLNCAGRRLMGSNTGNGIYLNGATGVTIQNCYVQNFTNGIYVSSGGSNSLISNTALYNAQGFYLSSSSSNALTGNTALNNSVAGIFLVSSSSNTLTGNTANYSPTTVDGGYGIAVYSSSNNNLNGNTASSNNQTGIYVWSSCNNNTITGNTANSNQVGIRLMDDSLNNSVSGNTAISNTGNGINIESVSNDNTVSGNTVSSSGNTGIYMYESINNTLSNNNIGSTTQYGIRVWSSENCTLATNTISSSGTWDIFCESTTNNTRSGNTCSTDKACSGCAPGTCNATQCD